MEPIRFFPIIVTRLKETRKAKLIISFRPFGLFVTFFFLDQFKDSQMFGIIAIFMKTKLYLHHFSDTQRILCNIKIAFFTSSSTSSSVFHFKLAIVHLDLSFGNDL